MSNIFPIDFDEKLTMAQNDYILFSDSEDGNKIKKAQYKNLKGEKGDTGATGPQGPEGPTGPGGAAATITVGTTTTGNAGTNASVTNSGTSSAAVFNFTIPKGADGEDGDAKLFTLSGTSDLTNAQASYDWYLAGKYPVIKYGSKFYYLYSASSSALFWVIPYDKASDGSSTTGLYRDGIKMDVSSGTITAITTTTVFVANSNYLRTGYNYPTPYTPEYNGSPATKKYVDDSASTKQDTLVSGTNIKTVNNQSLLGSGDITVTGGSDIEYVTQAEYTALLPGAESDGKHYFIYSTDGGGWQPGVNTIVYFPLEDDLNDYTGNYTLTTHNSAQIGTVGGVKCLDCTSSTAWASCSISTLPQGGATRTEMCWVKWTVSGSGEQPIWSYGQGSFNKVDCALRDGGIFWTQYGGGVYPSPTYTPTIGDWYHVAVTIDGSTEQKLYINGVLVVTGSITVNTDGTNLYFSHQQWGSNYGKNCISKFIVESTIRTAQEISDYYDLTKGDYGIS